MARLVLVKIGVDVIQFDELAFNVYVYAEEVREWGAVSKPSRAPSFDIATGTWLPLVGDRSRDGGQRAEGCQWQQLVHAISDYDASAAPQRSS
jgi:hypothetical protein